MLPHTASRVEGYRAVCQDKVAVFERGDVVVAVVADGAGGTAGGEAAAIRVVEHVRRAVEEERSLLSPATWRQVLLEVGVELEAGAVGQTTAVVVATGKRRVVGASVGDSGAWRVAPQDWNELTAGQSRKPLLGDDLTEPAVFEHPLGDRDALLVATDGLLKYARAEALCAIVRQRDTSAQQCCERLVECVRLPGGQLQDDVGVIVIRPRIEEIERRMASQARAWGEAQAGGSDAASAERDFAKLAERWIAALLPSDLPFSSDGLELHAHRFGEDGKVAFCGFVWRVDTQTRYPVELRLKLAAAGLASFELLFGDADAPDGFVSDRSTRHISLGDERKWTFRCAGP